MSIADEIRKLDKLYQSGALTEEEFARAKQAVLDGRSGDEEARELSRRQDVADLGREWEIQKEQYMVSGRYGFRYVPKKGHSLVAGVVMPAFGIIWTVMAFNMSRGFGGGFGSIFPAFGVLFALFGVGMGIYLYNKASEYEKAYENYRRRRADLLGEDRL